jgi:hypothetical protein
VISFAVISERQKAVLKRQDAESTKEKAGFFNRKKDQEGSQKGEVDGVSNGF